MLWSLMKLFLPCINYCYGLPSLYVNIENEAIFNYRARSIIENSFGILASRWRLFNHTNVTGPRKTTLMEAGVLIMEEWNGILERKLYAQNRHLVLAQ